MSSTSDNSSKPSKTINNWIFADPSGAAAPRLPGHCDASTNKKWIIRIWSRVFFVRLLAQTELSLSPFMQELAWQGVVRCPSWRYTHVRFPATNPKRIACLNPQMQKKQNLPSCRSYHHNDRWATFMLQVWTICMFVMIYFPSIIILCLNFNEEQISFKNFENVCEQFFFLKFCLFSSQFNFLHFDDIKRFNKT